MLDSVVDLSGSYHQHAPANRLANHHNTCVYTVRDARYAKGQKAVSAPSPDGFKTRAGNLLSALKFRYSHRERAYIGSPSKVAKFERLCREGWDADWFGELTPPDSE